MIEECLYCGKDIYEDGGKSGGFCWDRMMCVCEKCVPLLTRVDICNRNDPDDCEFCWTAAKRLAPRLTPTAKDYRVKPEDIDESVCIARLISGGEDKRWSPTIYRERQCGKSIYDDDLCKACCLRAEKYADDTRFRGWTGRVTEEPLPWLHMLDTEWAEAKQPKFNKKTK